MTKIEHSTSSGQKYNIDIFNMKCETWVIPWNVHAHNKDPRPTFEMCWFDEIDQYFFIGMVLLSTLTLPLTDSFSSEVSR
jgi:hypothetical protein